MQSFLRCSKSSIQLNNLSGMYMSAGNAWCLKNYINRYCIAVLRHQIQQEASFCVQEKFLHRILDPVLSSISPPLPL